MFENSFQLLVTCTLMFAGAIGAGSLPWLLNVSDSSMLMVATFGGGLMIGTALGVVCPEGFAQTKSCTDEHQALHMHSHGMRLLDANDHVDGRAGEHSHDGNTLFSVYSDVCVPHWMPGLVLCLGFMCMMTLDVLQHKASRRHGASQVFDDVFSPSKPSQSSQDFLDYLDTLGKNGPQPHQDLSNEPAKGKSALVGLLLHAAADGFAVGAAAMSSSTTLAIIVGAAMVLHKGPVAFGLTTFLMRCRWASTRIFQALTVFAAMSPVAAIVTFLVLRHVPHLTTPSNIGLCVIFSAGTFMYAACMHILPAVVDPHNMSFQSLGLLFAGAMLPCLFSLGHSHAH